MARGHKGHIPTNADTHKWALTPQQEAAVDLLAAGQTVTDTAQAIKVTRQSVSEWLNHDPAFRAGVNARRQELWEASLDTLRGLLPRALEVLRSALEGETPLPAAVHVLKALGLYGVSIPPAGPTEAADAALEQKKREGVRRTQELMLP